MKVKEFLEFDLKSVMNLENFDSLWFYGICSEIKNMNDLTIKLFCSKTNKLICKLTLPLNLDITS